MSNGNTRTKLQRVPKEWASLVANVVKKIEENGYSKEIYYTYILRLLIHYRPARTHFNNALQEIIKGFQGINEPRPEVEKWMKG